MKCIVFLSVLCSVGCAASHPKAETHAFVQDKFGRYEQVEGDLDYIGLVAKSMDRDADAMFTFLSMQAQYRYDGAASEGHAEVLGFLLRYTGDEFFGAALNRCSPDIQERVHGDLYFDMAWDGDTELDAEAILRHEYPITFSAN